MLPYLIVVDGLGRAVGPYLRSNGEDYVILWVNDVPLQVLIRDTGLNQSNVQGGDFGFTYYYTSSDCTGTRYYPGHRGLIRVAGHSGTTVLWAAPPFEARPIMSQEIFPPGSDIHAAGVCLTNPGVISGFSTGVATTADVSSVPNTPPFNIR